MAERVEQLDLESQAADAARAAAGRAGVTVGELDGMPHLEEASMLLQRIWSRDEPLVDGSTLRALSHAGNYVAGAWVGNTMVGAIVGFLGTRSGELELHSHVLGVVEEARGRNVGFALKQHQRAWTLARGITTVTWTFDPLVRRNAYFNLVKLGAHIAEYYQDFYGAMGDGINGSDESDRVLVRWRLAAPEAVAASARHASEPDVTALRRSGRAIVLAPDGGDAPLVRTSNEPLILAWIPEDIVQMRSDRPDLAARWRLAVRETVGRAVATGYAATGITRDGWLLLEGSS